MRETFTRPLRMGRQPNIDEMRRIYQVGRLFCCYPCLTGASTCPRWRP